MYKTLPFYLVLLSMTTFAFLEACFTWHSFRDSVYIKTYWLKGYVLYFLSISMVILFGRILNGNILWTVANTMEMFGSYFQFLGFETFYRKQAKQIDIPVFITISLLNGIGALFLLKGNRFIYKITESITFIFLILAVINYTLAALPRNRKIIASLSCICLFVPCMVLILHEKQLQTNTLGLNYFSNPDGTTPVAGILFISLLGFFQNQMANNRLRTQLERNIQVLHEKKKELTEKNVILREVNNNIVEVVAASLEKKLSETSNHVKRVSEFTRVILKHLRYAGKDAEMIVSAAALHDIGKIGIPDELLGSTRKITRDEMMVMEKHTLYGYEILGHSQAPFLQLAAAIALEHHENWDGSGYPLHKKGTNIGFPSRVITIADTFDALVHKRSYKEAWNLDDAVAYIIENSGKKFDPEIIQVIPDCLEELSDILEKQKPNELTPRSMTIG